MTFKMCEETRTLKVFNYRVDTLEFIGAGDAWIPPHTGLPANCTLIEPPATPENNVAIFKPADESWSLCEDYRGQKFYSANTGQEFTVTELGPLPSWAVTSAPSSPFDIWNGSEWVRDEEAERMAKLNEVATKKNRLIEEARQHISEWQSELMLGSISDANKKCLQAWLNYIQALKDVNPENPLWPDTPQSS